MPQFSSKQQEDIRVVECNMLACIKRGVEILKHTGVEGKHRLFLPLEILHTSDVSCFLASQLTPFDL